eukprot:COSAG01_NODE_41472_length_451_cov_0.721591_1_plen_96_part_10
MLSVSAVEAPSREGTGTSALFSLLYFMMFIILVARFLTRLLVRSLASVAARALRLFAAMLAIVLSTARLGYDRQVALDNLKPRGTLVVVLNITPHL